MVCIDTCMDTVQTVGMTTTRQFGTWVTTIGGSESTPGDWAISCLTDFADDYEIGDLRAEFLAAVNEALPTGLSLYENGDIIGPVDYDGPAVTEATREAVDSVDFWAIAEKHDTTA